MSARAKVKKSPWLHRAYGDWVDAEDRSWCCDGEGGLSQYFDVPSADVEIRFVFRDKEDKGYTQSFLGGRQYTAHVRGEHRMTYDALLAFTGSYAEGHIGVEYRYREAGVVPDA